MKGRIAAFVIAVLAVGGVVLVASSAGTDEAAGPAVKQHSGTLQRPGPEERGARGRQRVTVAGMFAHLRALQQIADRHGGNRAAGTAGDRASVDYVAGRLRDAGYRVRAQPVSFPYFDERGDPRVRLDGEDLNGVRTLVYSGGGAATGAVREVDPRTSETGERDAGCRASDFAGLPAGAVALIERGTCRLRRKVDNAARAGASAAVIFNDGRVGREGTITGTLASPGAEIPAVFASFDAGRRLAAAEGRRVRVTVRAISERRTTANVVAELPGRGRAGVVMGGAHLDSVADGPGINDNGSGVAALLESAEALASAPAERRRALRFGFWGAEELGLIGSRRYIRGLDPAERERIAAYVNLDMIGSRNAGRFLYAGDDAQPAAATARRVLGRAGVALEETDLSGGSDHVSFDRAGIPVAGLFSGASGIKSSEQRGRWGGRSGAPFDRCYHRECDRLGGIDRASLGQLGRGAAGLLRALARR